MHDYREWKTNLWKPWNGRSTKFAGVAGVRTAASSARSPELLRAPEEQAKHRGWRGECLLALGSENSLVGLVWCLWKWHEVAGFVQNAAWVLVLGRDLQAKFRHWQVVAGAGECVRSMWDVRGRRRHWQEGDGGKVVADTAGESQVVSEVRSA